MYIISFHSHQNSKDRSHHYPILYMKRHNSVLQEPVVGSASNRDRRNLWKWNGWTPAPTCPSFLLLFSMSPYASPPYTFLFIFKNFLKFCVWVFPCIYVCVALVCPVPMEATKVTERPCLWWQVSRKKENMDQQKNYKRTIIIQSDYISLLVVFKAHCNRRCKANVKT